MDAEKAGNYQSTHKSIFKVTQTSVFVAAKGKESPPYFKELILVVCLQFLVPSPPYLRWDADTCALALDHPEHLSIPDKLWQ